MATKRVVVENSGDSGSEDIENNESEVSDNLDESEVEENDDSNEDLASGENESDEENGSKNSAWADSVSKILKSKPKANKPLILSKAKKLTDVKSKPQETGFEVVLEDGNIKKDVVEEKTVEKDGKTRRNEKRKREIPGLRVKPDILEKDRERVLTKIATRGVVQLFNAVKMQQNTITKKLDEAGPLEVRKEKVLKSIDKNSFLDVLMGQKSQNVDEALQKEEPIRKKAKLSEKDDSNKQIWGVLKDNFMMDAKMKDWDKELEIEEDSEMEQESEVEEELEIA